MVRSRFLADARYDITFRRNKGRGSGSLVRTASSALSGQKWAVIPNEAQRNEESPGRLAEFD